MLKFESFRNELILEEELLMEAWSQEDMARSLHSLKKNNNGLYKSEIQGKSIRNQASHLHSARVEDPKYSNNHDYHDHDSAKYHVENLKGYGIPVDLNKHTHAVHVTQTMDMGGYSAQGYRAGKGLRRSHNVFMLDQHGIVSHHKLHEKEGQIDPKKTEHVWERPKSLEIHPHEKQAEHMHEPVMTSEHQGTVGTKHTFEAHVAHMRNLGPSSFGSPYSRGPDQHMTVFKTKEGHILHHFGTPPEELKSHMDGPRIGMDGVEPPKTYKVTATVKKHHVDKMGNNVTVLTRPKIVG